MLSGMLSEEIKITQAISHANGVAGTTAVNGAALDMQNWDGVLMVVTFGVITVTAVTSVKAQQGAVANMSDAADLLGTGQAVADTDDEKVFYIDLNRPQERYVRLVVARGTANAVIASAEYIQYRGRKAPVTHATEVSGEKHVSPIEGTA